MTLVLYFQQTVAAIFLVSNGRKRKRAKKKKKIFPFIKQKPNKQSGNSEIFCLDYIIHFDLYFIKPLQLCQICFSKFKQSQKQSWVFSLFVVCYVIFLC